LIPAIGAVWYSNVIMTFSLSFAMNIIKTSFAETILALNAVDLGW
jgi:hypothetical protein